MLISGQFGITQENQNWLIQSREISSYWGNFLLFQKVKVLELIKKNSLFHYICGVYIYIERERSKIHDGCKYIMGIEKNPKVLAF